MSAGNKNKLEHNADDMEWSIKVTREVIFPEIYERYGPNAKPKDQLPTKTLDNLRREVYGKEHVESGKPGISVIRQEHVQGGQKKSIGKCTCS